MVDDCALQQEICSKERVIAAARQLFSSRGFHRTAMSDLAKEAQVSVGGIYRCFPSKADIINAIIMADTARFLHDLEAIYDRLMMGELDARGAVELIIQGQFCKTHEALSHEIMAEAHRDPGVADTIGQFCVRYRQIFRHIALHANPDISNEDLDGAEELLLACMFGLAHRKLARPHMEDDITAKVAAKLILQSIGGVEPEAKVLAH